MASTIIIFSKASHGVTLISPFAAAAPQTTPNLTEGPTLLSARLRKSHVAMLAKSNSTSGGWRDLTSAATPIAHLLLHTVRFTMSAPAPAPAATPTTAAAPAPATAPVPAASTASNGALFPEGTSNLPPAKKRKIQARCDSDPALKHTLDAVVGTKDKQFKDGMLYEPTITAITALWDRLDFVQMGTLKQIHFQSVRGVDPIWDEFLDNCDVDGDGDIRPAEFVAGFVFCALEKRVSMNLPPGTTVTGWEVVKSIMDLVNEHVMEEVMDVKRTMGWN